MIFNTTFPQHRPIVQSKYRATGAHVEYGAIRRQRSLLESKCDKAGDVFPGSIPNDGSSITVRWLNPFSFIVNIFEEKKEI